MRCKAEPSGFASQDIGSYTAQSCISVNTHCDQPTPVSALEFVCRAISFSTPTARMHHQCFTATFSWKFPRHNRGAFPTYLFIYLSIYLSIYVSICLSIHPSIYLFLVTFWLPIFSGKKTKDVLPSGRNHHEGMAQESASSIYINMINMTNSIFLTINPPSYTWDSPYASQKNSKSFIVSPPNIPKSPVFCGTHCRFQAPTRNHNQAIRNIFGLFAAALKDVGRSDNKTSQQDGDRTAGEARSAGLAAQRPKRSNRE